MFAFATHPRFWRRDLGSPGSGRRIVARAAAAACSVTCIAAAVASPASASPASASPASASPGIVKPAAASRARPAAVQATGTSRPRPAFSHFIVVTNLAGAGPGSLRAAIRAADATAPGTSTLINFNVAGTITLASRLPAIKRQMTLNGASAPRYRRSGPPLVEIDCNSHGGLHFAAGSAGSQLLGLAVDDSSGNGVTLRAGTITLNGNYIGLNLRGAAAGNHGDGVYVSAASAKNFIGLNASGASGAVANVISGNGGSGLVLAGSSGNTVVANRIGTNRAGTARIGNGGDGLAITGRSDGNEIGGTEYVDSATGQANNPTGSKGTVPPVFVVPPLGNLISGNARDGVLIASGPRKNVLNGNFVGTTASGDAAIGNGGDGVWIRRASGNSLTGCKFVNNPFVYYNVLSGNGQNGLRVTDSDNVLVQGNFFGTGANNTATVRNRLDGVRVDGSSANTQVGGVIPLGNVSAGNGRNGIEVAGRARGFITFNTFGGLLAFKGAAPNGRDGLLITSTGGDNLARTNVFSGNRKNGIELAGHARGVTIDPDIAGLTTSGKAALPNGGDGVLIDGAAHGNVVGGSLRSVIPQNTFSGNRGYGLAIAGLAHGNRVFGTFIGTKIAGVRALGNQKGGVLIAGRAYRNLIGRPGRRPSNLISGNTGHGVTLGPGSHLNRVIGNFIGLDRFGRSLPNTGRAIVNSGYANIIRRNRYLPI
jgi:parallel beta-helix repeat protein